jgi:hypothetical protein
VLQCATTCFSVLQCVAVCCSANGPCHYGDTDQIIYIRVCCSILQCVSVLQWIAVDCSVLKCVAVLPRLAATVFKSQLCGEFTRHI